MYKLNIYTVYTSQHIYTTDTHIKTRVNHTHTLILDTAQTGHYSDEDEDDDDAGRVILEEEEDKEEVKNLRRKLPEWEFYTSLGEEEKKGFIF